MEKKNLKKEKISEEFIANIFYRLLCILSSLLILSGFIVIILLVWADWPQGTEIIHDDCFQINFDKHKENMDYIKLLLRILVTIILSLFLIVKVKRKME